MKKLLPFTLAAVTLGLAAAVATPGFAQFAQRAHPAKAPGARIKKLADALGLTDAQKAQLKPMLKNAQQQAKAIKTDTTLTAQAKQAKMKDLRKSTNQQMLTVLTPDQRLKLKALRQQQRAAKGG